MKVLFLLIAFADANAPVNPNGLFCDVVKAYVRVYGEEAAIKWAKRHKWTDARIAEARECRLR